CPGGLCFGFLQHPNASTVPRGWKNPWRPRNAPQSGGIHSPARFCEPAALPGCTAGAECKRGETGRSETADRWRVEEKLSGRLETCHGQSTEARGHAARSVVFPAASGGERSK